MAKKGKKESSALRFVGINILLAMFIGICIIVGLVLWLRAYTQHGVEVQVEDVRGMLVMEAEPVLSANGLRLEVVDSTYSDKVPFGTIVEQDPKPESHAKHGRAVYVTINASTKRQIIMPNLQDMSYRQAETTLRGLGLVVDSFYIYEPSEFRDLVLDVKLDTVSLYPGDKVPVGSKVQLVVGYGKGTEYVRIPGLVGLTLKEARGVLLHHRLTLGAVYYDEPAEEGVEQYIYSQKPDIGEKLLEGETVTLWLSSDMEKALKGSNSSDDDRWF
jgi:beta-lactam-binding protein with PASTA domain